jgi:hypothetical protein
MNDRVLSPNQYHSSAYNSDSYHLQSVPSQQLGILEKLRKRGQKMPYSKANNSVATTAFDEDILSSINSEKELDDLYWNHRKMEPFTTVRWLSFYLFLDMMAWVVLYIVYPINILMSISLIFSDGGIKRAFFDFIEMSTYIALPAIIIKAPLWFLGRKKIFPRNNFRLLFVNNTALIAKPVWSLYTVKTIALSLNTPLLNLTVFLPVTRRIKD